MNTNKPAGGAQFTPGPWSIRKDSEEKGSPLRVHAPSRSIAQVWEHDQGRGNAALIAAAPEMYMALQAFIKAVSFEGGTESIPLNILIVADRAKDALAQAEGRQA